MASERLKRPPALARFDPVIAPPATVVFQPYAVHGFTYQTQYVVNVNPVHLPPHNDVPSLRQPISVAGWRRNVRTHMATPLLQRFDHRVIHVGKMEGHGSERDRMRGVLNRGYTYVQPAPDLGPGQGRTVQLGQQTGGGRARRG